MMIEDLQPPAHTTPEAFTVPPGCIEIYAQEGAVCIPSAFSGRWVEQLLTAHDRIEADMEEAATIDPATGRKSAIAHAGGELPALTYHATPEGHFGIRHACFHDPDFKAWLFESPAASIVGQVTGAEHVRFWWDQSFCKIGDNPGGATQWHSDIGAFSFFGDHLPSFWIALTDVGVDNAPLTTIVGSHKDKRLFRPAFGKENVPLGENYFELDEVERKASDPATRKRVWTMKAGDCLVIHPYCQHASLPPRQKQFDRRIAFTSRWLGSDVIWNKREMSFDYPEDIRCRNVEQGKAPPEEGFPILWRREA